MILDENDIVAYRLWGHLIGNQGTYHFDGGDIGNRKVRTDGPGSISNDGQEHYHSSEMGTVMISREGDIYFAKVSRPWNLPRENEVTE